MLALCGALQVGSCRGSRINPQVRAPSGEGDTDSQDPLCRGIREHAGPHKAAQHDSGLNVDDGDRLS
jgi:hypothetical protein